MRHPVAGQPEHPQETVEDRVRVGRRLARIGVEPAQIDEEHPIERFVRGQRVTHPYGKLGLADPRHAGDGGDRR